MGTRGLYGFRKNGIDKVTYNHFDSYPDWLGRNIVKFCIDTSKEEMCNIFDAIKLVKEKETPTQEQQLFCINNGLYDKSVSDQSPEDWYCLLRKAQGELGVLKDLIQRTGKAYMIDNIDFIRDSCWCEYAYIINLDTDKLEFYIGFQNKPQQGNRYGIDPVQDAYQSGDGYYPCKLALEVPLDSIKNESVVGLLESAVA